MKSALKYSRLWQVTEDGISLFPKDLPKEESYMEVRVLGQLEEKVIDKAGPTEAQVLKYTADFDHWTDLNT